MNFFRCPTEICFGSDALARLQSVHASRVLIVTDRFFLEGGQAEHIGRRIPGAALSFFSDVKPDPDLKTVAAGIAQLRSVRPEVLLALGGGSVLDCAKGMLALLDERPYFIAVPTTSGTGSEVTSFSILTHEGVKHALVDRGLLPQLAILDDTLLQRLPSGLIAESGMDAVSNCVEAICAKHASAFSSCLAEGAFSRLLAALPRSFAGDTEARGTVHAAATMAGLAFDHAGLGLCHALAHALGGQFHIPHGRLCGVLLPHIVKFNAQQWPQPYASLAQAAGFPGSTDALCARNLVQRLHGLKRQLALPLTLKQAGIPPQALHDAMDAVCTAALQDTCADSNPRPADKAALRTILREAAQ